jgi:hypothetical protein
MPNSAVQGYYIEFGSAWLFCLPNGGNQVAAPQPVFPLTVQDVAVETKGKLEELRGQYQWPDDTALGDKSGTFKFGIGRKDWYLFNQIYFSDTVISGGVTVVPNQLNSVPATTSYVVTPTLPATGVYVADLGVIYASGANVGKRLQEQTGSLTQAGQYQVNVSTGVYTFDSADASAQVYISFSCTVTSGSTYEANNQIMGYGPQCELFLVDAYQPTAGVNNCLQVFAAKVSDVGNVGGKRSGYAMPEISGQFYANSSGQVLRAFCSAG